MIYVLVVFMSFQLSAPTASAQVEIKAREIPPRGDRCHKCHIKKGGLLIPKKHKPEREHEKISLEHGNTTMSCNHCHDKTNSNYLRSASFTHPSPVCQRCHPEIFREWTQGVHGKRTGQWNGPREQLHCIECHNPHSVKFKKMEAVPPPVMPRLAIPKHGEHPDSSEHH